MQSSSRKQSFSTRPPILPVTLTLSDSASDSPTTPHEPRRRSHRSKRLLSKDLASSHPLPPSHVAIANAAFSLPSERLRPSPDTALPTTSPWRSRPEHGTKSSKSPDEADSDSSRDDIKMPESGTIESAEIWNYYRAEATRKDAVQTQLLDGTMKSIMITAGLFSSILVNFLVNLSNQLDTNYAQEQLRELKLMRALQWAIATNQTLPPEAGIFVDKPFVPSRTIVSVNVFWYLSLVTSIATAIGAMLMKQWLAFSGHGRSPDPYHFALQHRFRDNSFKKWRVAEFINALPLFMIFSVGLFFGGLTAYLFSLVTRLGVPVTCYICIFLALYWSTNILVATHADCPYKTSSGVILRHILSSFSRMYRYVLGIPHPKPRHTDFFITKPEEEAIERQSQSLILSCLSSMLISSHDDEVVSQVLEAVSMISHWDSTTEMLLNCNGMERIVERIKHLPLPAFGSPPFGHEVGSLDPSNPVFAETNKAQGYLRTLISLWRSNRYFGGGATHHSRLVVSPKYDTEWRAAELSSERGMYQQQGRHQQNRHLPVPQELFFTSPNWLLGPWYPLLHNLKDQHGSWQDVASKKYDMNFFAAVACVELVHYQHQMQTPYIHEHPAYLDIYVLLEGHFESRIPLEDTTATMILDTIAAVFAIAMDNADAVNSYANASSSVATSAMSSLSSSPPPLLSTAGGGTFLEHLIPLYTLLVRMANTSSFSEKAQLCLEILIPSTNSGNTAVNVRPNGGKRDMFTAYQSPSRKTATPLSASTQTKAPTQTQTHMNNPKAQLDEKNKDTQAPRTVLPAMEETISRLGLLVSIEMGKRRGSLNENEPDDLQELQDTINLPV